MSSGGLDRLNVWVQAKQLAIFVYKKIIPLLPPDEKWGLAIQIKRAVASIPANIAEGYGRYYYQENVRFCYYARGSLEETISHVTLAAELEFLPQDLKSDFVTQADILSKQINGYIAYLRRSNKSISEPGSPYMMSTSDDKLDQLLKEENDGL